MNMMICSSMINLNEMSMLKCKYTHLPTYAELFAIFYEYFISDNFFFFSLYSPRVCFTLFEYICILYPIRQTRVLVKVK